MIGICHVVGGGDFNPALLKKAPDDLVIAADAGFRLLEKAGIKPDLFIGDGDSLGFLPEDFPTVVLPTEKDDTDSIAALKEGLARGYRRFRLYGALGGTRFSHSLANLQSLSFLHGMGAEGEIIDKHCRILYLSEGTRRFDFSEGYFSLFAWEGDAVVSVSGAKYSLDRATLTPAFPLGVSNEGSVCTEICVHLGTLFLVREDLLRPDGANA